MSARPRVYLAGPGVFRPDALAYADGLRMLCARHGLAGVFPLDGAAAADAPAIFRHNLALIDTCAGVLAELTPFRGLAADPGTAFEIGYAYARGLPVVAWTADHRVYRERLVAAGQAWPDGRGGWIDAAGLAVEDFGLVDNLMPVCAARAVEADPEPALARLAAALGLPAAAT